MKRQNLLRQITGATLGTLLLVGCGSQQIAPAATSIAVAPATISSPLPPTATQTPLPPTATSTPMPPTPTPTPAAGIGIPVTSGNYEVTVADVSTATKLKFSGVQDNRVTTALNGHQFLIVEVKIRLLDPAMRAEMEKEDNLLKLATLLPADGKVLTADGGGYDKDHYCAGEECKVAIMKGEGVMFYWGPAMDIRYPPEDVLYEGGLVFTVKPESLDQPFQFQFQGAQITLTAD